MQFNLGSHEDLFNVNPEKLKQLNIQPKINPRLKIIREEEQKMKGSFVINPEGSCIKKIDDSKIDDPLQFDYQSISDGKFINIFLN